MITVNQFKALAAKIGKVKAMLAVDGEQILDADGNPVDVTEISLSTATAVTEGKADEEVVVVEDDTPEDETAKMASIRNEIRKGFGELKKEVKAQNVQVIKDHTSEFKNLGTFLKAVRNIHPNFGGMVDKRLVKTVPGTFTNETVAAQGGFTVPYDFLPEVLKDLYEEDNLINRVRGIPCAGNNLVIPTHEHTSWGTGGGIASATTAEGGAIAQTRAAFGQVNVLLQKYTSLVPVTEELLEDNPVGMESFVSDIAGEKIAWDINNDVVNGTGPAATTTLGIVNSGGTKTQAIEAGQTSYLVPENINNMWRSMLPQNRRNAVWLINQELEDELEGLFADGTSGSWPVFMPAGGLSERPYDTLKGRPIIYNQYCPTPGTPGDIILADMGQYIGGIKTGGLKQQISVHVFFEYDVTAFKFTMRFGGQPWRSNLITGSDGVSTYAHFVMLGTRVGSPN